ncbi:unnamed protein product [Ilex paraguariensis]|uniref:Uncharacterized protein n=1 Tax=Ilex paraguariensis TaxID=185542 RepID=A0ABC8RCN9_9AQUA
MGDLQVCCERQNGVMMDSDHFSSSSPKQMVHSNPDPLSIREDCWAVAEETTQEVVNCIHPTLDSEEKRKDVIDYVQRLISTALGCEVFPYGSVPLKTYLPDGDIDLTALSSPDVEESLGRDVLAVLQAEEMNKEAEYEVKDTHFIDAEVKLVKCLVRNIVIDISFNQLGGLCTLCFLEQIDRLVDKNHIFKRSIILIKVWCYYESRILGAHHGLISTYALEMLVLCIFRQFHASLNGPLAVLYRFLDYFSKFDWENYCISLNGPVLKSSLPYTVVELSEKGKDDLMLNEECLRNCIDMYSVPSRDLDTRSQSFPQKHLNIIDPLKENNNLGRSVHRGSFYRILSAFKYGARKLGKILLLPRERIADEIKKFFANTLERHGCKCGADIQSSVLSVDAEWSSTLSSSSHAETLSEDGMQLKSLNGDSDGDISGVEHKCTSVHRNELDRYLTRLNYLQIESESGCSTNGTAVSGYHLAGDENDLETPRSLSFRRENDTSDCSPTSSNFKSSLSGICNRAPYFYLFRSPTENVNFENGNLCPKRLSEVVDENRGFGSWLEQSENHLVASNAVHANHHEGLSDSGSAISSPDANSLESLSLDFREIGSTGIVDDMETLNPLADLSGDHDSHIRNLLYSLSCHGYALSAPVLLNSPTSLYQLRNKRPLDTVQRSMPLNQNACSQVSTDKVVLGSLVYPHNFIPFNPTFDSDEKHMAQGTGTYFSIMNGSSCREKSSQGERRNYATGTRGQMQRHTQNNGMARAFPETNSLEEGSRTLLDPGSLVQGHGKPGLCGQSYQSNGSSIHANGLSNLGFRIEFGSLGLMAEGISQLPSGTSYAWDSTPCPVVPEVQTSSRVLNTKQERVAEHSYHHKNEDFPPLSS